MGLGLRMGACLGRAGSGHGGQAGWRGLLGAAGVARNPEHPPASPHLTPSDARRAGRNHPHGGAVATRRLPGGLVHAPAV